MAGYGTLGINIVANTSTLTGQLRTAALEAGNIGGQAITRGLTGGLSRFGPQVQALLGDAGTSSATVFAGKFTAAMQRGMVQAGSSAAQKVGVEFNAALGKFLDTASGQTSVWAAKFGTDAGNQVGVAFDASLGRWRDQATGQLISKASVAEFVQAMTLSPSQLESMTASLVKVFPGAAQLTQLGTRAGEAYGAAVQAEVSKIDAVVQASAARLTASAAGLTAPAITAVSQPTELAGGFAGANRGVISAPQISASSLEAMNKQITAAFTPSPTALTQYGSRAGAVLGESMETTLTRAMADTSAMIAAELAKPGVSFSRVIGMQAQAAADVLGVTFVTEAAKAGLAAAQSFASTFGPDVAALGGAAADVLGITLARSLAPRVAAVAGTVSDTFLAAFAKTSVAVSDVFAAGMSKAGDLAAAAVDSRFGAAVTGSMSKAAELASAAWDSKFVSGIRTGATAAASAAGKAMDVAGAGASIVGPGVGTAVSGVATAGKAAVSVLGGIGLGLAAVSVESFKAAAQVQAMSTALSAVAKQAGISQQAVNQTVAAVVGQNITWKAATQEVTTFVRANLSLTDAQKLAADAQNFATLANKDSSTTLQNLTWGIQSQNERVLRTAGATVQVSLAEKQYADQLGITTTQLTANQKQQAVLQAVLENGTKVSGAYAASMQDAGKVLTSLPRVFNNIAVGLGQQLLPVLSPIIIDFYNLATAFAGAVQKGGVLSPVFQILANALKPVATAIEDVMTRMTAWIKTVNPDQVTKFANSIKGIAGPVLTAATAFGLLTAGKLLASFTGLLGLNFGKIIGNFGELGAAVGEGGLAGSLGLLLNPVTLVVAAFGALVAASPQLRDEIGRLLGSGLKELPGIFDSIRTAVTKAASPVTGFLRATGNAIAGGLAAATRSTAPSAAAVSHAQTMQQAALHGANVAPAAIPPAQAQQMATLSQAAAQHGAWVAPPPVAPYQQFSKAISDLTRNITAFTKSGIAGIPADFGKLGDALKPLLPGLESMGTALLKAFSSATMKNIVSSLSSIFGSLVSIGAGILTNMMPAWNALTKAFDVIAPVITDLARRIGDQLGPIFSRLGPIITPVARLVGEVLSTAFLLVAAAVKLLAPVLDLLIHAIGWSLKAALDIIGPPVRVLVSFLSDLLWPIQELVHWILGMSPGLIPAFEELQKWFGTIAGAIGGAFIGAWHDFLGVLQSVWGWVSKNWPLLVGILTGPIGAIATVIIKFHNQIWDFLQSMGSKFLSIGGTLLGAIAAGFGDIAGWTEKHIISPFVNAFDTITGKMKSVGIDLIHGMMNGITQTLKDIRSWITKNIFDPIVNGIKSIFGIKSPSTVMAGLGGHMIGGLMKGLMTGAKWLGQTTGNISGFITKAFGSAPEALATGLNKGFIAMSHLTAKAKDALHGLWGSATGWLGGIMGHLGSLLGFDQQAPAANVAAGNWFANLQAVARYMAGAGWAPAAASGIAGNVYRESGGNPLAVGAGARGLIQWTPGSRLPNSAFIPSNPTLSLDRQLPLASAFFRAALTANQVREVNALTSPQLAALAIMNWGERPAGSNPNDPFSYGTGTAAGGIRAAMAKQIYSSLYAWFRRQGFRGFAGGGVMAEPAFGFTQSGRPFTLAERGPEVISPLRQYSRVVIAPGVATTNPQAGAGQRPVVMHIHQQPGESSTQLVRRISSQLGWAAAGGAA